MADGVEWRDVATGDTHAATAEVVVLAGGCVESPRLWQNSGLPDPTPESDRRRDELSRRAAEIRGPQRRRARGSGADAGA